MFLCSFPVESLRILSIVVSNIFFSALSPFSAVKKIRIHSCLFVANFFDSLCPLRLSNWELELSGILKNRDFFEFFFGGIWVFGLKTRVRGSSCND